MTGPDPDHGGHVVDARGTRCPTPVIRVARVSRDLVAGTTVVLLADDVAARADVPAWGRMRGHTVTLAEEEQWTRYTVVVGGAGSPKATGAIEGTEGTGPHVAPRST